MHENCKAKSELMLFVPERNIRMLAKADIDDCERHHPCTEKSLAIGTTIIRIHISRFYSSYVRKRFLWVGPETTSIGRTIHTPTANVVEVRKFSIRLIYLPPY